MSARDLALDQAPALGRVPRRARGKEAPGAFWGLMAFTVVLFVAPQNFFPALQALAPAKLAVGVAIEAAA